MNKLLPYKINNSGKPYVEVKIKDVYFKAAQRQATKDAGTIASLNVERTVNEPTAAALVYCTKPVEIEALSEGIDISETVTRARFEELNMDLFKKTIGPVKKAMKDAGFKKTDIREIVLVGGSTRIPKVQQLLKNDFNGKELSKGVNPDEPAAYGAIVQELMRLIWFNVAFATYFLVEQLLLDTALSSLGLKTIGGLMTKLIPRNNVIPTKNSQIFGTCQEQQNHSINQGERSLTKDCRELGQFDVPGIPSASRGVPQIEVTFQVDRGVPPIEVTFQVDAMHAKKDDLDEKMKELEGVSNPVPEAYAKHGASLAEENIRASEFT
ncbi:hypothetical protein RJ639_024446 [Escallonia herrerae]|uniref:Heat shock protein 70 n=1 Tax=Escallonia herrerae TaxID=1293975 RepID=A0AA88UZE7_9ASTE|nr:hypothetical protein RJ639_024446 [Escallonia herrerae]